VAPRRTKSTEDHGHDLDFFLKKNESPDKKKNAISGSRSVSSMPAKASAARRRRVALNAKTADNPTKPASMRADDGDFQERMGRSGTIHYHDIEESDGDDDDDNQSIDLDLATARNFTQQNMNAKIQMHMSRTNDLLYSVFPKHVANSLRDGKKVEPENHDLVTIFFSDIVGFTDISSKLDPMKISEMLDRLYHSFDALSDYHDVFKVET
jgi:hypothetical protein